MTGIPSFWGKGALLTASVLAALLSAEGVLRLTEYDLNPSASWRYHATLGWTMDFRRAGIDEARPDGFRYRSPEGTPESAAGNLIVLGDSFVAGVDFPYAATMPARLEDWLNQLGMGRWNVISLAVNDWGTAQQWLALREVGLPFRPDAVIVQIFPFNDFCNNSRILAHTCSLQDLHRPYFTRSGDELVRVDLHPWRSVLRSRFRLFGLIENRIGFPVGVLPAHWMPDESDPHVRHREFFRHHARKAGLEHEGAVYALLPEPFQPASIRESWEVTRELLRRLKLTAERVGAPLVGLVIPFMMTFEPEWSSLGEVFPPSAEREYGTRRFEEYLAELGVPTVSVRSRIEGSDMSHADYFISPADGHLNPFGHAECAAWLAEVLRDVLDLPGPPPSVHLRRVDLTEEASPAEVVFSGLGAPAPHAGRFRRDGLGPSSSLAFRSGPAKSARLEVEVVALVPDQELEIALNGEILCRSPRLDPAEVWRADVELPLRPGRNVVVVGYREWIGREETRPANGRRPLAARFLRLTIDPGAPPETAE